MRLCAAGQGMRAFAGRLNRGNSTLASQLDSPVIFVGGNGPARQNALLGPNKNFPFPGDVGIPQVSVDQQAARGPLRVPSASIGAVLEAQVVKPNEEHLEWMEDEAIVERQAITGDWPVELSAQSVPRLLQRDLYKMFAGLEPTRRPTTVLNLTQKANHDQSAWSAEMETERDMMTASFITVATELCATLSRCGYWADFIDPASGRPFLGRYTQYALFETDDAYKQMGFRVVDLGCCKVVEHLKWGRHAFVGTVFTNAPLESDIVKDILKSVNTEEEAVVASEEN